MSFEDLTEEEQEKMLKTLKINSKLLLFCSIAAGGYFLYSIITDQDLALSLAIWAVALFPYMVVVIRYRVLRDAKKRRKIEGPQRERLKSIEKNISYPIAALSILLLAFFFFQESSELIQLKEEGVSAHGVVVHVKETRSGTPGGGYRTDYTPIVDVFIEGREIGRFAMPSTRVFNYRVNEEISVIYHKDGKVIPKGAKQYEHIFELLMALALIPLGFLLHFFRSRKKRES